MKQEATSVFVVDDDVSVREALTNLFRSVGLSVRTFGSAQEFMSRGHDAVPSCLVLDIRLPGESGLDLQLRLAESNDDIPIIFITGHGDIRMSVRAMKAGAVEFLTKPFREQELLDAVHQAIDRDRASRRNRMEAAQLRQRYEALTSREKEVMALVVQGLLNKQIADELQIAEPTVKLHRGHVMEKMGASSLADLVRMAERVPATA